MFPKTVKGKEQATHLLISVWSVLNSRHICESGLGSQGVLRVEQEIEIRPGIVSKDAEGKVTCVPIYSRIKTLFAELNPLQYAVPGGLIGVGTTVGLLTPHAQDNAQNAVNDKQQSNPALCPSASL